MCEESCKEFKIVAVMSGHLHPDITFLYGVGRAKTHLSYVEFNSLSFGHSFSSIRLIINEIRAKNGGIILHLAAGTLRSRTIGVKEEPHICESGVFAAFLHK